MALAKSLVHRKGGSNLSATGRDTTSTSLEKASEVAHFHPSVSIRLVVQVTDTLTGLNPSWSVCGCEKQKCDRHGLTHSSASPAPSYDQ
jgi:hypothetical protein